jgi:hypothetical protein
VAKVAEVYDREIFGFGHLVSGHTLKHLVAAGGVYLLLRSLERRAAQSVEVKLAVDVPAG